MEITNLPIDVNAVTEWVTAPHCGAVVCFTGTVRDESSERTGVTAITYEVYERFAGQKLEEVIAEAHRRWDDLGRAAIVHRSGTVALGEASVAVAISAPHRDSAFEAARFCIDLLKCCVPVWKLEHGIASTGWVQTGTQIQSVIEAAAQWDARHRDGAGEK
ncbi:molybdenum cofactor biosynthesis protein MoaE [Rhodococcus sp. NPDC059968]|uniref:molybdenum cofactor biosynthesis protein MoaE n=1 Tax=Rhodococcus sp. NPDC059968 TaxID=3347017 RepID=UPI00367300B9